MKEFWLLIQAAFAGIGEGLGYFLGGCDGLLYALVVFVVADYITGVIVYGERPQALQRGGLAGNLPESADLYAHRNRKYPRYACGR